MKRAALALALSMAPVLSAPLHAAASSIATARLFDLYYPGEEAYAALKSASAKAGKGGWLADRMSQGQAIPQASARELALDLQDSQALSADEKANLALLFSPEKSGLKADTSLLEPGTSGLEEAFVRLNTRLSEIEETTWKNNYNKQSYPGLSVNLRSAYINTGASGLLKGSNEGYFTGRLEVIFNGQANGGGFSFGIAQSLAKNNGEWPVAPKTGSMSFGAPNFEMGYAAATFQVTLGGGRNMGRSPLIMGGFQTPAAPNNFVLNFNEGQTTPQTINELKLGLPYGDAWLPNLIHVRKQGSERFWPFEDFEVFYGPEDQFVETWNTSKILRWGGVGSIGLGDLWGLIDTGHLIGSVIGVYNDRNILRSYNLGTNPTGSFAWSVQSKLATTWAGELHTEYAQAYRTISYPSYGVVTPSLFKGYAGGTLTGFERRNSDEGFATAYTQGIGFFNFGLEYSRIGPLFDPNFGAVSSMILYGPDHAPASNSMTPWQGPPQPAGYIENKKAIANETNDISWGTDLSTATGLISNAEKVVLQAQTSWSWISFSAFGGVAQQLKPTGPWMKTQPHVESGAQGFMLYDRFGERYYYPPGPGAPTPPAAVPGGGWASNEYYLWDYNRGADGTLAPGNDTRAIPRSGAPHAVHWNGVAHMTYRRLDFYTVFSQSGVGDRRLDLNTVKYINYAAGSLKFDIQSLLGRLLPFELQFFGETRDVAPQAGLPSFGEPGVPGQASLLYFTQGYGSAYARYGLNKYLTLLGIYAYEEWKSNHSFFPMFTNIYEYGAGLDIDGNEMLTGLSLFTRARILYWNDLFLARREMNVWDFSVGSSLSF